MPRPKRTKLSSAKPLTGNTATAHVASVDQRANLKENEDILGLAEVQSHRDGNIQDVQHPKRIGKMLDISGPGLDLAAVDKNRIRAAESSVTKALSRRQSHRRSSQGSRAGTEATQDVGSHVRNLISSPLSSDGHPTSVPHPRPRTSLLTGTPLLSLSNFKRRPRQPSLLSMVQAQDVSITGGVHRDIHSDEEIEDSILRGLNGPSPKHDRLIGLDEAERRRTTSTVLSSGRKRKVDEFEEVENQENLLPSSPPIGHGVLGAHGDEDDDEEEITQRPATRDTVLSREPPQSIQRHRRSNRFSHPTELEPSEIPAASIEKSPSLPSMKKKRRSKASAFTQETNKRQTRARGRPDRLEKWQPLADRSPTPLVDATSPVSSSPPQEDDGVRSKRQDVEAAKIAKVRVTYRRMDGKPSAPGNRSGPATSKSNFASTATLRALLPKRRLNTRRHTQTADADDDNDEDQEDLYYAFDLPNSSPIGHSLDQEDSHENEDSTYGRPRKRSKRQPLAPKSGNAKIINPSGGKAKGKSITKPGTKNSAPPSIGPTNRTYNKSKVINLERPDEDVSPSQQVSEDEIDDSVIQVAPPFETTKMKLSKSIELKSAARKFRDVDDWELSFESCDVGGGDYSSPWR